MSSFIIQHHTILFHGVKFDAREEYAIEALEEVLDKYVKLTGFDPNTVTRGREHHKSAEQRLYDRLSECIERLKKYANHIKVCGEHRNSYSKTDHDATFMRMKRDYMGNDQPCPDTIYSSGYATNT